MITGHPHDLMLGTGTAEKEARGVYVLPRQIPASATQWMTCWIMAGDYWERFHDDHLAIGLRAQGHPGGRGIAIGSVSDGATILCGGTPGKIGIVVEDFDSGKLYDETCREIDLDPAIQVAIHATYNWVAYTIQDFHGEVLAHAACRAAPGPLGDGPDIWIAHTSSFTPLGASADPAEVKFWDINDGYFQRGAGS